MLNGEKLKGHILILITNILFAINMPISKYLLPSHVQPEALTIMRMGSACLLFWLTSLFIKREKVTIKDLGLLFICAMCGVGINQGLFIVGLNRTSPVDASIIATGVPIFVMLLAAVILKEPITKMKALGVLMGCIGGISLILASTHATGQASSLEGNLMIIVSAFVYSIYLVLSKPLSLRYSAVTMMKWMFLFSTLVLLPFTYRHVLDTPAFQRETLNMQELGAISFVTDRCDIHSLFINTYVAETHRPTTVSMYNYIQPIIASLIAVMIGQDTFSLQKVLSAVLVFTGVYLVTQSKSRADLEKESR